MATKKAELSSSVSGQQKNAGNIELHIDNALFKSGCEGELRQRYIITTEDTEEVQAILSDAIDAFVEAGKFSPFEGAIANIIAFALWLDDTQWKYEAPVLYRVETYSVSITLKAPSGEITISMEATPLYDNYGEVIKAMHKQLSQNIKDVFGITPNQANSTNNVEKRQAKQSDVTEAKFDTIRVSTDNTGHLVTSIIPNSGRFQKFGIRVFPNQFKKFGVEKYTEEGDYEVTTAVIKYEDDGKYPQIVDIDWD